jgi:hypothetical protein
VTEKKVNESMPATTTEQEDLTKAGQRKINLIWEDTQSRIALFVVVGGLSMSLIIIVFILILVTSLINSDSEITSNQLALLSLGITSLQSVNLTLGIVIGFYFSRTNHMNVGGVGAKDNIGKEYYGR